MSHITAEGTEILTVNWFAQGHTWCKSQPACNPGVSDAGHILPWFVIICSSKVRAGRASENLGPTYALLRWEDRPRKGPELAQGNTARMGKLTSGALWKPKGHPISPKQTLVRNSCKKPCSALHRGSSTGESGKHWPLGSSLPSWSLNFCVCKMGQLFRDLKETRLERQVHCKLTDCPEVTDQSAYWALKLHCLG